MIKINLLPVRAAKKKETTRQQISILVITVVGTLAVCAVLYSLVISKISHAKDEISRTEQEIQQLKTKIGEIDNIKKLQAEVKKKLDILNRLRKEKTGPVSRLAMLSDAVPDKLWLTKYSESAGTISLSGAAFSEDDIAALMKNLQAIPDFTNVELQVSEQTEIAKTKAKRFDITLKLAAFAPPEPDKKIK
ncbi:type IV pilus biogenesis protein PilN [Geotalea daltonii FRC-32]|uniref:Type IV pilus biogenesis protein PilN n=1 Tax=Geotalea daltonii (strain DSM 22248 / JCM 15807 / FRC-32) TaxID=316067 RepID=B9M3J1_GEODF|nr:PilN domain-containing protein [Geotalea daltonii]ACM21412.1 type IV pilus biogenesis protein PilN [Geotalea daltonii FRC-32]